MMEEKYKNAMVFSGGGTRIMIYLGMYAALEDLGKRPDVLLATCGGALAATVINAFADNFSRKEYLKSEEYFNFVKSLTLTEESKLKNIGLFSLKKILNKKNASFLEDVFNKYLVEMPQDLDQILPSLKNVQFSSDLPTIIIGSEMLFKPSEIGTRRNDRKLYRKLLITDLETSEKIDLEKIKLKSKNYLESAVTEDIIVKTDLSMLLSSRISASDMFYIAPVLIDDSYFAGGAIDLVPVEIAKHLAKEIIIEKKQNYNKVEEALVRAVLGYSGNARLQEINFQNVNFEIDTTDIKNYLKSQFIAKKIDWHKFKIKLTIPETLEKFRKDQHLQWNYGYERTMACFGKKIN